MEIFNTNHLPVEKTLIDHWRKQAKEEGKIFFLIIAGDSCSGKTTRSQYLGLNKLITATSRKPRSGEIHGKDYWFWNYQAFNDNTIEHETIELTKYANEWYGIPRSELTKAIKNKQDCFVIVDIWGVLSLRNILMLDYASQVDFKVIYYTVDKTHFLSRITKRNNPPVAEIKQRWFKNLEAHSMIKNQPYLVNQLVDTSHEDGTNSGKLKSPYFFGG